MIREHLGYIAGMIDGEGTISLYQIYRKKKNATLWCPVLDIYNNNREMLEEVVRWCGLGTIATRKRSNPKHKTSYVLKFTSNEIRNLLPQIEPLLLIKRRQAKMLIYVLSILRMGGAYSTNELEILERSLNAMRVLNRRGADAEELLQVL